MKRPTWATIVGVITIVLGIFGVASGIQSMFIPSFYEVHSEIMTELQTNNMTENQDFLNDSLMSKEYKALPQKNSNEQFESYFKLPAWYIKWAFFLGVISTLISIIYLISGVFLLTIKPYALRVFYIAIGLSLLWTVLQAAIFMQTKSFFAISALPSAVFSIIFDLILLIVALVGDKDIYQKRNAGVNI